MRLGGGYSRLVKIYEMQWPVSRCVHLRCCCSILVLTPPQAAEAVQLHLVQVRVELGITAVETHIIVSVHP